MEIYEELEMTVFLFENEDVITGSPPTGEEMDI